MQDQGCIAGSHIQPAMNLACNLTPLEDDRTHEEDDARQQADHPGDRTISSREAEDDVRQDANKEVGKKVDHCITTRINHGKNEVCDQIQHNHDRSNPVCSQMEEVEVVSCDAKHDQHDEYEQGHDARRTQAPLEETHDAEFEDNQPHGKQETPVEIKTSPGTDVEHEVSTEAGDDNSPYDKELNLVEEGCDLQCSLYREVGSFRLTT